MNMSSNEPTQPQSERFQRWQKITIAHFSYVQNIFLTFSIAAIGYWFSLLQDEKFLPGSFASSAMRVSIGLLFASAFLGAISTLNRLRDFRGTAKRARNSLSAPTKDGLDALGQITWATFYLQIAAFLFGIISLALGILLTYGSKLG